MSVRNDKTYQTQYKFSRLSFCRQRFSSLAKCRLFRNDFSIKLRIYKNIVQICIFLKLQRSGIYFLQRSSVNLFTPYQKETDNEFEPTFSIYQNYPFQSFWAISFSHTKSNDKKNSKSHAKVGQFHQTKNHK